MTKWQYGFAVYKPAKQSAEAFNNMIDMAEIGKKTLARSLEIAGEKGGNYARPPLLRSGPVPWKVEATV